MKFNEKKLENAILELIRLTSTSMSEDVIEALKNAKERESIDSPAKKTLQLILENIDSAKSSSTPICQDTGTCTFYVKTPPGISNNKIIILIENAIKMATKKYFLRPNSVNSITGENSGNNIGIMSPYISFEEWDKNEIQIQLILKGGGSENVSTQYKLPNQTLNAGRNLKGVYKCIIDAVFNAQGLGCAPGIIGIGIGGDRITGMITAKKQLFRKVDDINKNQELGKLEQKLYKDINSLGIGPMGFGGKTTVLGVKIGDAHRLPASFFVSVAYMCWAMRRKSLNFTNEMVQYD